MRRAIENCTIHGVKYITNNKSKKASRTFWLCAFILSIVCCIYNAYIIHYKFLKAPDIGVKIDFKSARNIPFPALTICPQNRIKKSFFDNTAFRNSEQPHNFSASDDDWRYFEMAYQICYPIDFFYRQNQAYKNVSKLDGEDIVRTMREVQYSINETFFNVWFEIHRYSRVLTSEGFCFSFNLMNYSDIFNEGVLTEDFDSFKNNFSSSYDDFDGYRTEDAETYPRRISTGSINMIAFLLVHYKNDEDAQCVGSDVGFKIYWHMPNEIPMPWHRNILVRPKTGVEIAMKATKFVTSMDLQKYSPEIRGCYFEGERKLQFFRNYTKSHCDFECLANYILKRCGCVRFFMPHNSSVRVCNITRFECARDAQRDWPENDESYMENKMACNCYPSCAEIKYEIVMSDKYQFDERDTVAAYNQMDGFQRNYPGGSIARFKIFFEDLLIENRKNYLAYRWQNLISDFGGLLGLFIGCSLLSIVEIFYFIFNSLIGLWSNKKISPMEAKNSQMISKSNERNRISEIERNISLMATQLDLLAHEIQRNSKRKDEETLRKKINEIESKISLLNLKFDKLIQRKNDENSISEILAEIKDLQ